MTRTLLALAATVGVGAAAAIATPFRAVTPGTLSPGHERHRDDCLACHTPFRGPARANCVRCHAPDAIGLRAVDGRPRPLAPARGKALAGMHVAVGGGECYRCHIEHSGASRAGARLRFTHGALPAAARTDCAACHAGNRPADRLHAQAGGVCAACHRTDAWKPATYDHDRFFRFDARHPPRCDDCHAPGQDFRTYDCTRCHEHARERMIAEHREERVRDIDRCARCHRSGGHGEGREGRWEGGEREDGEREDD